MGLIAIIKVFLNPNSKLNNLSEEEKAANTKEFYEAIQTYKKEFYINGESEAKRRLRKRLKDKGTIYSSKDLKCEIDKIEKVYEFSYDETKTLAELFLTNDITLDKIIKTYARTKQRAGIQLGSFDINPICAICKILNINVDEGKVKRELKKYKDANLNKVSNKTNSKKNIKSNTILKDNLNNSTDLKGNLKNDVINGLKEVEGSILKDEIYPLLEKFIITNTQEFDNEKMTLQEYMGKIDDLIEFLKHKKLIEHAKNIDTLYLKHILEQKKWTIYEEKLKAELNLTNGETKDEIISKYINYYGSNCTNSIKVGTLSKMLKIQKSEALLLVKKEQLNISKEYKMKKFEEELFGNKIVTLKDIDKFNGYEFEDFLASLYKSLGFEVEQTSYSGDYGADLIIKNNHKKTAVQAKNYSGNVGLEAVQQALSGKNYYKCDSALVVTNSYFTRQAKELAASSQVELIDRDKLNDILEKGISCY